MSQAFLQRYYVEAEGRDNTRTQAQRVKDFDKLNEFLASQTDTNGDEEDLHHEHPELLSEAVLNNDDTAERSEQERVGDFFEESEQCKDEDRDGDRVAEAVNNDESAERSEDEHGLELEAGVSFQSKSNYFTFYSELTDRKIWTQTKDHRIDAVKCVCVLSKFLQQLLILYFLLSAD